MDREGVDVHLIIPATWSTAPPSSTGAWPRSSTPPITATSTTYCSADPAGSRRRSWCSPTTGVGGGARSARYADEPWVGRGHAGAPGGLPIDDPVLDPFWEAMDEADLPIMHHSFFYEPPYFPGYRDIWGNVVVARAAAHPWGAQRLLGYFLLSGLFDRYPNLRIGFAECSAGWLPAWLIRLPGQATYMRTIAARDQAHAARVRPAGPDLLRHRALRGRRHRQGDHRHLRRRRADVSSPTTRTASACSR